MGLVVVEQGEHQSGSQRSARHDCRCDHIHRILIITKCRAIEKDLRDKNAYAASSQVNVVRFGLD
jgi:hypothetical protein